jgi:tetratricopeptide (TPR) repeat protein
MSFTLALIFSIQLGPNAGQIAPSGEPEELIELRRRNALKAESEENAAPTRLEECLALAAESPIRGADFARGWREVAKGEEIAQSTQCLGFVHVRSERYGEALASFATARSEASKDDPAYRARLGGMAGNAALADGNPQAGEPWLAQAVDDAKKAEDPILAASLAVDLARALVDLGRAEEGKTKLLEARTLHPANDYAWLLSAVLERRDDNLAEAQGLVEQALSLDPENPLTLLEAGLIAALSGDDAVARGHFQEVLSVAPQTPLALTAADYLGQLEPAPTTPQPEPEPTAEVEPAPEPETEP